METPNFESYLSAYSKWEYPKKRIVLKVVEGYFTQHMSDEDALAEMSAIGLNDTEAELGIRVARYQRDRLAKLGTGKGLTTINFSKSVETRVVKKDRILQTLMRHADFSEEEATRALEIILQNAREGSVLTV
ncbi:MAG: hypothetical protein JNM63_17915 [Spirochaetia bacterium]|nr:hypothetical protein [Spirochaetia bacterium]